MYHGKRFGESGIGDVYRGNSRSMKLSKLIEQTWGKGHSYQQGDHSTWN